jgi:hypothetical protein
VAEELPRHRDRPCSNACAARYTVANNQFRFASAEDAAAVQRHRKQLAELWTQRNATTTRLLERCDQGVIVVKR